MKRKNKGPKIVFFDLEILADLGKVMENLTRFWNQAGLNANISTIISFGYKVSGDKKAKCINAWDFPKRWKKDVNDDYEVVKAAYEILKDADVIVGHYSTRFDLPFLNSRLVYHGFPPLARVKHVDTWQLARSNLKLNSNRLDGVAKFFKLPTKMENGGWQLWVDVMARKKKAQKLMSDYCKQDVEVLEAVFEKMRCFVRGMPNHALWSDDKHVCPNCSSSNLHKHGRRVTTTNIQQRWLCRDCGTSSSTRGKKKPHLGTL